jgi:hypothetical protein
MVMDLQVLEKTGISLPAEELLAYQERLCSMELVYILKSQIETNQLFRNRLFN